MTKLILSSVLLALAVFLVAPQVLAAGCQPEINPHTYECHDAAFNGQTEFPIVPIDWANVMAAQWKATTYAVPGSNDGGGFRMLKDPSNPHRPEGVFNVFADGTSSRMGVLDLTGSGAVFTNWQNTVMRAAPENLMILDGNTVQFTAQDRFGSEHLFSCRDFIRLGGHHLDCQWSTRLVRSGAPWKMMGYFGFIR